MLSWIVWPETAASEADPVKFLRQSISVKTVVKSIAPSLINNQTDIKDTC